MNSSSRTRPFAEVTFRASETHFLLKIKTSCAPGIYPNSTKCCACHEKWRSDITKCCACQEKWHCNITKCCACHEKWDSMTKYCTWRKITTRNPATTNEMWVMRDVRREWCDWCHLSELLLDWAVTWQNCYLTGLLLDWAVTLLNFYFTELLLDWTLTLLNGYFTELLLYWTVTWPSCYFTEFFAFLNLRSSEVSNLNLLWLYNFEALRSPRMVLQGCLNVLAASTVRPQTKPSIWSLIWQDSKVKRLVIWYILEAWFGKTSLCFTFLPFHKNCCDRLNVVLSK